MIFFNLFLITLCCTVIIGITGIIEELEKILAKWLKTKSVKIPKPFSCELCSSHWVGVFYLLFTGHLTLAYYSFLLVLCILTPVIEQAVWHVRDLIGIWLNYIYLLLGGKNY